MTTEPSPSLVAAWTAAQRDIAARVIATDENSWHDRLRTGDALLVAGADISFPKDDTATHAVATLTLVELKAGEATLVYSASRQVQMAHPYIPSFLAFREAPVVAALLADLPACVRANVDCLLLDGNGVLHPRKAGLACHVGVEHDMPTVGVSKNLHCVDGLDEKQVRRAAAGAASTASLGVDIVGDSGFLWGRALLTGNAVNKPIYVSVGHRVSLPTAARLVRALCVFRVPEPTRHADLHSRAFLRGEPVSINKTHQMLA